MIMGYKETIIENFNKIFDEKMGFIIDEFLKENESNLFTSLEEEQSKILKKNDFILEDSQSNSTYNLSFLQWEEIKDKNLSFSKKIIDELGPNPDHEDFYNLIKNVPCILTNDDYLLIKNLSSFKNENQELIKDVTYLCNSLFVIDAVNKFISNLNAKPLNNLYVYRSLSTKDPEVFISKLSQENSSLGSSWSRNLSKAQSYEGEYNTYQIKLHGKISPDCIDYTTTLVKNISLNYAKEEEFFLTTGELVEVFKIQVFDSKNNLLKELELNPPIIKSI